MDPPEHLDSDNIKFQPIIGNLLKLRKIEDDTKLLDIKKLKIANPLLTKVLKALIKMGPNFVQHRSLWNELHDRMAFYYPTLNNIQLNKMTKTPIFFTLLHNDVVKYWYQVKNIPKIHLHFDTHDDMNTPDEAKKILKQKIPTCNKINYPVTCMLMSKKIEHLFWLMPEWVYDTDIHLKQSLHLSGNELYYLRLNQPKDEFLFSDEVKNIKKEPKKSTFSHLFTFSRVHTNKPSGFTKIIKYIEKKPTKFILDIDLDYFTTNGRQVSVSQYKKNFDDLESTYRASDTISDEPKYPRNTLDTLDDTAPYHKMLRKEVDEIKKRINIFVNGLKLLKKHKITPGVINISDSTPGLLDGHLHDAIFSNFYTPKYFVPYIHHLLVPKLVKLYNL